MTGVADIELVLLDAEPADERARLLEAALALRLRPGQEEFVSPPAGVVAAARADPDRHLLVARPPGGSPVALGVLHPGGAPREVVALLDGSGGPRGTAGETHEADGTDGGPDETDGTAGRLDRADVVLFRGFPVDVAAQGGRGGLARDEPAPGRGAGPGARAPSRSAVRGPGLTVDERNTAGRRVHTRAGLTDRGAYHGGDGPQRVMARSLRGSYGKDRY